MMKLRIPAVAAAVSLAVLTACSNGEFLYGRALGDVAKLTGYSSSLATVDDAATPQVAVTAAPAGPPLIVGFNEIRVAIPLTGKSGQSQTYAAPDGVILSMNSGFVTRAIGLGIDMNGSYLPADSAWFTGLREASAEGATTDRVIEYWKEQRMKRDKFRCKLNSSAREGGGTLVDETCKRYFDPETFVNRYWLRVDGSVECSRQWIHPRLDPLQFFGTEQQALTLDLTKNGC